MSQAELSRRVGLKSPTGMWKYETGVSSFSVEMLSKVAEVLGVGVEVLSKVEAPPEPLLEQGGTESREAALRWLRDYLRNRGFEEATQRWSDVHARVLRAAGDQGPTEVLAKEIVDLFLALEAGKVTSVDQAAATLADDERDRRRTAIQQGGGIVHDRKKKPEPPSGARRVHRPGQDDENGGTKAKKGRR